MGKFDGVLLASDFDNTLIYTEGALRAGTPMPPLSEKNRAALEYFMAEGGRFAIATGRALPAFIRFVPEVPMNAPGIVCNGASLYDFEAGTYLENALLDERVHIWGQSLLDRFPKVAVEAYHINNTIYAVRPNAITRQHEHLTKVAVTEAGSLTEVPRPLGKLLFEAEHDDLLALEAEMREQGHAEDYELVFSTPVLLELTAKGANKGGMVRRLAERMGISMEHVYCVGDEANDIPMLTVAAQGFAPANCKDVVRQCGVTVVSDAEHDALADVIAILDAKYA